MGILQSVPQYLGSESETDDEEFESPRAISSQNPAYYSNYNGETQSEQYRRDNILDSSHSQQTKHLTISVPNLRRSPSLVVTNVNDKNVRNSSVFIKEDIPKGEGKKREEGLVTINCTVVVPDGRWVKHYSSNHRILLVGDGDFSFSTCLAAAFGWAANMVATSLDSEAFLVKNYENALANIVELNIRKCTVMHEIDATKMANHVFLGRIKFDRIVFNFPFAGFFKNLSSNAELRHHKRLVSRFMKNAKRMLSENGEIHISHKTNGFHSEWNLESIASSRGLRLIEAVDFDQVEYPGYNTKYGFGGDNNFNCNPSKTYKFGLKSC